MRVLTWVPLASVDLIKAGLPGAAVDSPSCLRDLRARTTDIHYDLLILDPCIVGDYAAELLTSEPFQSIICILFCPANTRTTSAILYALRLKPTECVLVGLHDIGPRFSELLNQLPQVSITTQILSTVSPCLRPLSSPVSHELTLLFLRESPRSTGPIGASRGATRRTMDRRLASAGLASVRTWNAVARIAHSMSLIRDPGIPYRDIADQVGYRTLQSLAKQVRETAGVPLPIARRDLSDADFVAAASRRLLRSSKFGVPLPRRLLGQDGSRSVPLVGQPHRTTPLTRQ